MRRELGLQGEVYHQHQQQLPHWDISQQSGTGALQAAVMPLSTTQHLTATCVVMFISALGAGYVPTMVKVFLFWPLGFGVPI